MPGVERLRAMLTGRKGGRLGNAATSSGHLSYSDAMTQQHLIGQDPNPPRRSLNLANTWRTIQTPSSRRDKPSKDTVEIERWHTTTNTHSIEENRTKRGSRRIKPVTALVADEKVHNLLPQCSMSFPQHLRTRSSPLVAANQSRDPPSSNPAARNRRAHPWWEAELQKQHISPHEAVPVLRASDHGNTSLESLSSCATCIEAEIDYKMQDKSSKPFKSDAEYAGEAKEDANATCSDGSFDTCPTPHLGTANDDSTGSRDEVAPQIYDADLCKDACQSPLQVLYHFPSLGDDSLAFDQESEAIHSGPTAFIQAEDGATSPLRLYEEAACFRTCRYSETGSSSQSLLPTDPLQQSDRAPMNSSNLYDNTIEEEIDDTEGAELAEDIDEHYASSFLGDEEENSVEICQAWRSTIALSGIGASLVNAPLHTFTGCNDRIGSTAPDVTSLQSKQSRASMRYLGLDTIEEASFDSVHNTTIDFLDGFDVCAHLVEKARGSRDRAMAARNTL